ncbi:hypothetical protein ABBQ32_001347 [Trebouxia sp. C0010 RCD-2024]
MSGEGSHMNSQIMPDDAALRKAETGSSHDSRPAQDPPHTSEKGLALLGSWLRRGPQQQPNSSNLTLNTVKTTTSMSTADLGTPTWSESSEVSDFASVEASPAAKSASTSAVFNDPQAFGQQSHPRLAGRLGGWLTGVTSAAGMVLGGAVRGGTKALQRLTAQERLQDLRVASQHLEATASGLRGEARVRTLQKWCSLLQELHPSNLPLLHCYTVNTLRPSSPRHASCDSDWQQLQLAPPDPPDPNWSHSAASVPSSHHQKPGQGSSPRGSVSAGAAQHGHTAKGSEQDFWATQVLYLDQESPDTEKELLTFRELFLHSYALENIIVGYLDAPTSQPEDRSVLTKLFGLCLTGDSALHARLVDALIDLSAVEAECRGVGTSATLGPEQPALANVVAETICGLKIQAECEVYERKMAALKADIGEQAAEVHRNHKFNSGATEPTGEPSLTKLASGLVGTAEVMQLGSKFQQLSVLKAARVAHRKQPQFDKYLAVAQAHTKRLNATVADLEARADTTQKQKADGEAFRERKLAEMKDAMHVVDENVGGLEEQQAELQRQLAEVQQQITAAKAKRADMEEGCHVFQEGNAFTLEALQHKVDELSLEHRHRLAEHAALAECQCLIQEASSGWQVTAKAEDECSHAASQQAAQEFMHAATRHLYYQRALLQLLLRQLTFCVTELQGVDVSSNIKHNLTGLSTHASSAAAYQVWWRRRAAWSAWAWRASSQICVPASCGCRPSTWRLMPLHSTTSLTWLQCAQLCRLPAHVPTSPSSLHTVPSLTDCMLHLSRHQGWAVIKQ